MTAEAAPQADSPFAIPRNDVPAALAWLDRARRKDSLHEGDIDSLCMMQDDPSELLQALAKLTDE